MKRLKRIFIPLALALTLSACSPQEAIHMVFGDNGPGVEDQALRVSWCESEHKPWAVSPTNDHGLFQINKRWHYSEFQRVTGQPWEKVYDSFWNAIYAEHLWKSTGGNWQHWTCRHAA